MRLQKYLAYCGIASRRKSEEYIKNGRVKINGEITRELGKKINPQMDIIEFDNIVVKNIQEHMYILLNKPIGFVTTVEDQFNRKTVIDLVNQVNERIYPVGRLDYDTEGLLILTNDGNLTYRLTHPKYEIQKEYIAEIRGIPTKEKIQSFKEGLEIDNYITSPAGFDIIHIKNGNTTTKITIHEGKNRQIRKMCDKIGHPVITLKRIKMGNIELGNLPRGQWRELTEKEIENLKNLVRVG